MGGGAASSLATWKKIYLFTLVGGGGVGVFDLSKSFPTSAPLPCLLDLLLR
jgi:hypothetical protein